jgi:hypothetical protein
MDEQLTISKNDLARQIEEGINRHVSAYLNCDRALLAKLAHAAANNIAQGLGGVKVEQ